MKDAPVVRRPLDGSVPLAGGTPPQAASSEMAPGGQIVVHVDPVYVCVTEDNGQRRQTAIGFTPKVEALCRRHPEMGPCRYERDTCRRSGGRVYAANGEEITQRTEDEYDRKVMRVRFRTN